MHLQWIFLFLLGSCWIGPTEETMGLMDLSSLMSFMVHGDHDIGSDTVIERRLSRKKRDTSVLEYTADIEISFPDPSFANLIKQFLATNLTLPMMLGANNTQITSIKVTTACNQTGSSVQCSCESGYIWPSSVCGGPYIPCAGSSSACSGGSCIQGTSIPTQYCQPQPVPINLSLKINEVFTSDFADPKSAKYIDYKGKLEAQLNKSYQSLPGFVSVTVTGFRPGSIVADYTLVTEPTSSTALTTANSKLVDNLLSANISADPSIKSTVKDQSTITVNPKNIFIKDNVVLTCSVNTSSYLSVSWYFNSTQPIQNTSSMSYTTSISGTTTQSILSISGVSQSNAGIYTCIVEDSAKSYQTQQTIVVQPLTFTVLNTNVACNSIPAPILQCCTQGSSTDFNLTCMGGTVGAGVAVNNSPCWTYQLSIDPATCPSSVSKTYSCTCYTGNGANEKRDVNVIYQPTYVATVTSSVNSISEGRTLTMSCSCTATSVQSISWYLQDTPISSAYYTNDLTACRSTLTIPNTTLTVSWAGTYSCSVNTGSGNIVSPGKAITVANLIRSSWITTDPVGSLNFQSRQNINFNCCMSIGDTSTYPGAVLVTTTTSGDTNRQVMTKTPSCFTYSYIATDGTKDFTAQCNITNSINDYVLSNTMSLKYLEAAQCKDPAGVIGSKYQVLCQKNDSSLTGTITLICQQSGWEQVPSESNCVSAVLVNFQNTLSTLNSPTSQAAVQDVLVNLSSTVNSDQQIVAKPNNLEAVVKILGQAENAIVKVETPVMVDFLKTVNVVVANTTTWQQVENKTTASSNLLQSVEKFAEKLVITGPVELKDNSNIQLTGNIISNLTNDYNVNFDFNQGNNLTGNVLINKTTLSTFPSDTTVVTVAYATLKDILGSTNSTSSKEGVINGLVMTTSVKGYSNISVQMDFKKNNQSLNETTCVFWNFTIKDWDSTGCQPQVNNDSAMVSCACSHLTSFSVLMSTDIPFSEEEQKILTYITYFGLGISIFSLVVCIVVEATIWKSVTKNKTSYMRHLCIMNIAVTLLMADIWFIIGGAMSDSKKVDACVAATFFTHVFYLCTFFWMLTMGLILFYRLMCVFHDLSKTVMMGISFFLGYGCPIIISVITVAVTQPRKTYISDKACWLRVTESRAFLAFVIPALTILLVNFVTLFVVIIKVLRPSVGDRPKKEEKSTLNHIAKCILILTPLLGLTWGLGIGTLFIYNIAMHGIFSALNALQGLSILLFGCLLDKKVRDALLSRFSVSRWSSQQTKSTNLSSSDPVFPKGGINLFGRKGVYNISNAQTNSSSEMSNSYSLLT